MIQRRIRLVAVAAALATVLTFAAPAHAAGWQPWMGGSGWFEAAVQWVAGLWTGQGVTSRTKIGAGIDPNGEPNSAPTPPPPDADHGIDPNGRPNSETTPPDAGFGVDPNG